MTKEDMIAIGEIAKRGLPVIRSITPYKVDLLDLLMDVEYANNVVPMDLDQFVAFDAGDFNHDISGIFANFNRTTLQMDNCFSPRCAKGEL